MCYIVTQTKSLVDHYGLKEFTVQIIMEVRIAQHDSNKIHLSAYVTGEFLFKIMSFELETYNARRKEMLVCYCS